MLFRAGILECSFAYVRDSTPLPSCIRLQQSILNMENSMASVSHWNGITSVQASKEVLRTCFIRLQHLVAEYNPVSDLHITEPLYVLETFPNFSRTITKLQWHFRIPYCYFRTSQFHCRKFCIIVILAGVQKFQVTIMSYPTGEK
jgi:hypothetical protein